MANAITRFHAKYYAALLNGQSANGDIGSLSQSLRSSTVDINPHQIDAALFAFASPFSKGVVLADEVGLGKTIADCHAFPKFLDGAIWSYKYH